MKKYIALFSIVTLLIACSPKIAEVVNPVTPEQAASMSADVNSGKVLFDSKCHKCHKLKTIDKYTPEEWKVILPKMAQRAKLESSDESLIQQYVTWELQN